MKKPYLEVGQIVSTHGVRGELRVQPWCDSPAFFCQLKRLYFTQDESGCVRVLSSRPHGNIVLLRLEGIEAVEQAAAMRNRVLYMAREDACIPAGEYFIQDLLGCAVVDADTGSRYGTLCDVSATGANDVWHVRGKNDVEYLLPVIESVVIDVDVDRELIQIRPLKGIFDDED